MKAALLPVRPRACGFCTGLFYAVRMGVMMPFANRHMPLPRRFYVTIAYHIAVLLSMETALEREI